jgi:hypothetical protein
LNLQSVKKVSEIPLSGVDIEIESHNNSPKSLTIRDANGGFLRVSATYGIEILVPAKPKMVKKYRLAGKFAGLVDVVEDFDSSYDANQRLREYNAKVNEYGDETGLSVTEVEVPEEE